MKLKVKIQFIIISYVTLENNSIILTKNVPLEKTLNGLISISKSKIAPWKWNFTEQWNLKLYTCHSLSIMTSANLTWSCIQSKHSRPSENRFCLNSMDWLSLNMNEKNPIKRRKGKQLANNKILKHPASFAMGET